MQVYGGADPCSVSRRDGERHIAGVTRRQEMSWRVTEALVTPRRRGSDGDGGRNARRAGRMHVRRGDGTCSLAQHEWSSRVIFRSCALCLVISVSLAPLKCPCRSPKSHPVWLGHGYTTEVTYSYVSNYVRHPAELPTSSV